MINATSYKSTIFNALDPDGDIGLFQQSLNLRFRTFVVQYGWNLPTIGETESDQYDSIFAHHVLLLDGQRVIATIRLLPTTHDIFGITYMILDAHRGNLPGMPANIMQREIVAPTCWEASRMAICKSVPRELIYPTIKQLIQTAQGHIRKHGGDSMLGLMKPQFLRIFSRLGIAAKQFGPITEQLDGPIVVLKCDL